MGPVNARELLAVQRGLLHFQSFLSGATFAVFCDHITAVAYLRKDGGTRSLGIRNVLTDSLSRPHQLPSSKWSLTMGVFRSLARQWPVMIDLFATSGNHRCSIYFSPSATLFRRGRTRSSSPGTASLITPFRRGPFFLR